jgi:hypothetical protein
MGRFSFCEGWVFAFKLYLASQVGKASVSRFVVSFDPVGNAIHVY